MAKQAGLGTLVGSAQDIVGYAVDGRAYFRMKGGLDKAKWKRSPSMALSRDAARMFGAASMISAGIWKNVPREMKRIMGTGAFNRLVGACRMLVEEDGNIGDVDGFRGVDFSADPELAGLSGMGVEPFEGTSTSSAYHLRGRGGTKSEEEARYAVSAALRMDERGRMKDESGRDGGGAADGAHGGRGGGAETVDSAGSAVNGFSGWGGAKKRRFCVAEPFTGNEDPDFVVEHERLGTISAFREGLAALRAEAGRPVVRRKRVWVAVCEVPTVEWVPGGKGRGAFFLVQNGRHWLGKGQACSAWEQNSPNSPNSLNSQDSLSAFGGPGVRGLVDEALREALLDTERSDVGTGVFLVMVGLEVAEKRGRHWVRVPQMCRVRVTDIVDLAEMLVASPGFAEAGQVRDLSATEADSRAEVGGAAVDQVLESEVIVEVKAVGTAGTRIQWEHATVELLGILGIRVDGKKTARKISEGGLPLLLGP